MHLRGDKIVGITSNINHILIPKQWRFRTLSTLKDEHLKSHTIKCIIKVCIFHENVSKSPDLYCHNKLVRELQTETENLGKEIRFPAIVFCYKLNTENERLFIYLFYSLGCFLKMEIKHQTICSYLVFYTTVLHRWKKWILATRHEAHSHCYLMYVDIHAHAQSLRSCPTLCDPMDCSLPGTSVHRISQARILE